MSMTELSYDAIDALLLPDRPLMEDVVDLHHRVIVFDEIDSTNDEAKRLLQSDDVEDGLYLIGTLVLLARRHRPLCFHGPYRPGSPPPLHPL